MDITPVFGTVIGGSNPSGSTKDRNYLPNGRFSAFVLDGAIFTVSANGESGPRGL
jgi:hypothetical protein